MPLKSNPTAWDKRKKMQVAMPNRVQAFLAAYASLAEAHGLAFAHEDSQGAFLISDDVDDCVAWATVAHLDIEPTPVSNDPALDAAIEAASALSDRRSVLRAKIAAGEITREEARKEFPESF